MSDEEVCEIQQEEENTTVVFQEFKDAQLRKAEVGDSSDPRFFFRIEETRSGFKLSDRKYCLVCYEKGKRKAYGPQTSASNYSRHLESVHDMDLKKMSTKKQKKITDCFEMKAMSSTSRKDRNKEIRRHLTLWICRALLPFNIVEHDAFKDLMMFLKVFKDKNEIPRAGTLSKQYLDELSAGCTENVKDEIRKTMENISAAAITTDGWSDKYSHLSYLTITIHFIDSQMNLKSFTLKTFTFEGRHTAKNISAEIKKVLEEFELQDKRLTFVTDGGSNFVSAIVNELKYPRSPCLAHGLHRLVVFDFLGNKNCEIAQNLQRLLSKIRTINKKVLYKKHDMEVEFAEEECRKKWEKLTELCAKIDGEETDAQAIADFDIVASENEEKFKRLKTDCETRWSSTYEMVKRFLLHEAIILFILDDIPFSEQYHTVMSKERHFNLLMSEEDIECLKDLVNVLEIFSEATRTLEAQKYPTSNLGILVYLTIKSGLSKLSRNAHEEQIKGILSNKLDSRFPISDEMLLATLLDPGSLTIRPFHEMLKEKKGTDAATFLKIMADRYDVENQEEVVDCGATVVDSAEDRFSRINMLKRLRMDSEQFSSSASHRVQDEFATYSLIRETPDNLLDWWSKKGGVYPLLQKLVREVFSIPMTSAPSERAFSSAGLALTAKRSRLNPLTVTKVLNIHDNYRNKS